MTRSPGPLATWAESGLGLLTGPAGGPPTLPATEVLALAEQSIATIREASAVVGTEVVLAPSLLSSRAALAGWERAGAASCGGTCRVLPAGEGWVAVQLARPDDVAALPAWLGRGVGEGEDPWPVVAAAVAAGRAEALVERAQLLGIPAAVAGVGPLPADEQVAARWPGGRIHPARVVAAGGAAPHGRPRERPLVVDLTSLWAGPLCAAILGWAGARVVKVESARRPDGARLGPPAFFAHLHAGHESVALDPSAPAGRAALAALVAAADVVLEASRPRALAQLGIDPAEVLTTAPGRTWVSITAYGRTGPWCQRVGFGDDTAAAGGLLAQGPCGPVFVGDALADPLAGLVAAAEALRALASGGGVLVDVALRDVAAVAAAGPPLPPAEVVADPSGGWVVEERGAGGGAVHRHAISPPVPPRTPQGAAPPGEVPVLGRDTACVLAELT